MTVMFLLKRFNFLAIVLLLSCSVKDEPLIGFAVFPGNDETMINSKIISKNILRGNFIYACSEKASLSDLVSSLSDAGCSKIIIRGEALVISGYLPSQNAVIIDPPDAQNGFRFDAEFALKRADDFRKKKFLNKKYALILPDKNELRIIADKYFEEYRYIIFLKFDYERYDSYELERSLSRLKDIDLIIHYSGYSSERIKSFCFENGIYSASVFSDLEIDAVNIFSAEKDFDFAGEFACLNNHGEEIVVMPSGCVKITEYTGK
ncbi:MAG TPA: hypothetical protein PK624_01950 [Spirochaetota bacterium]|nr:hypothetical protein [Spirochaetota bacterium]HOR43539.1 hypothetical protein [Spirochaetota bacterium]HPK55699.1 hypothetical protein [Spirochaetota bacterium]